MKSETVRFFFLTVLLAPLFLRATVNEPPRFEFFSGYRNDRQHWHLQTMGEGGALLYSELTRNLQFWENGIDIKTIHRDLVFYVRGSYSAFGRGDVFNRYDNLSFTSEQPQFTFSSHGFAADTSGYFGYAVNLTADRMYKVLLIPLLGISAHFETLSRGGGSPSSYDGGSLPGVFTMHSSLPKHLHQTWYGFFLGAGFQIEAQSPLVLQAGYSYHWLRLKFKSHIEEQVEIFTSDLTLVSNEINELKVSVSEGGNHGHTGWGQLDYLLSKVWRLGIGAQIHYFPSKVITTSIRQNTETLFPDSGNTSGSYENKFKLRWTSVSGYLQTSRAF